MSSQKPTTKFTQEELNNEKWKSVVGFESVYSVSNFGRVRRDTRCRNTCAGYIFTPDDCHGYCRVTLRRKHFFVHNLVANAFLGPKPEGFQVNHKNAIKSDNRPENLEYITPIQNVIHAVQNNLFPHGDTHHNHIWAAQRTHCSKGHELTPENIAKSRGISQCKVCVNIAKRKRRAMAKP